MKPKHRYEVKTISIKDLKFDSANPNKMTDKQEKSLANSLEKFGYVQPVVVDKNTMMIADGEHRVTRLVNQGVTELDVFLFDFKNDAERRMFRQTANKLHGFHDIQLDAEEFAFIQEENGLGDLAELLAMEEKQIISFIQRQKDYSELKDEFTPREKLKHIKKGDIWQLGKHKLMCGDCTGIEDISWLMEGEVADLCITDPPYGVSYADKNAFLNAISRGNCIQTPIKGDHDSLQNMKLLWDKSFKMIYDFLKEGGVYYINGPQGGELMMMMMSIVESGLELKHTIIWVKNNHVLGRSDYNYKHEPILYGWKGSGHKFYATSDTSVWEHDKPHKSDLHPTMKPIELVEHALKNSSIEGDKVLDLFGGSGTTLIACEHLNRQCFMMEIDPYYCSIIIERWEQFVGQEAKKVK